MQSKYFCNFSSNSIILICFQRSKTFINEYNFDKHTKFMHYNILFSQDPCGLYLHSNGDISEIMRERRWFQFFSVLFHVLDCLDIDELVSVCVDRKVETHPCEEQCWQSSVRNSTSAEQTTKIFRCRLVSSYHFKDEKGFRSSIRPSSS